ncbi:MAG: HlyD family efflux transporter periplasmic adaptor subunit, partial [Candidatus Levybacteria bacterium]|nr:HlyD family efflux transporter periplasmic adaptor subunit [Candidatus Levybacteria bacterium]
IGAGQTVATLEKEKLEANLRQAWQDFTAAKAKSDKYYDSHKDSSESYQENLKGAVLTSPISGLVISVDPSIAGVNVTPVNASYEIINPSSLYLKVTADQTEIGSLSEGQKGTIIFDAYPEEKIIGEIENISFPPDTDETGTVYDIKVIFLNTSNNDYKYRLGMTADVDFVLQGKTNTIIIPTRMIKSDGKGKFVLVGKEKRKTYIKTGIENGQDSEITSGLKEGDVIYD